MDINTIFLFNENSAVTKLFKIQGKAPFFSLRQKCMYFMYIYRSNFICQPKKLIENWN